jgi:hypothetical protein
MSSRGYAGTGGAISVGILDDGLQQKFKDAWEQLPMRRARSTLASFVVASSSRNTKSGRWVTTIQMKAGSLARILDLELLFPPDHSECLRELLRRVQLLEAAAAVVAPPPTPEPMPIVFAKSQNINKRCEHCGAHGMTPKCTAACRNYPS